MLSILHREMRVAARRPWTFRIRLWTNIIAFILAAPMVLFYNGMGAAGAGIFQTVIFVASWFCLLQGLRLAASSISDEKREGTLGFLFLTDLKPFEIVAGKLFGIFLPMIQPLLAFLPLLTITVLLGGVTGGEIFRAGLSLGSLLIWSVSVALFISAFSRNSEETGKTTLVVLLLWIAVPRMGGWAYSPISWLSPRTAYLGIFDPGYRVARDDFWISLLITVASAFLALVAAAFFLPRRWEEHKIVEASPRKPRLRPVFSDQEKARILSRNPGEWLAMRLSMHRVERRIITFLMAGLGAGGIIAEWNGAHGAGYVLLAIGLLIILIRMASQASYPLSEAKRSGAVEMILSTPLNPWLLIRGQIHSLWTQFRIPICILSASSVLLMFTGDLVQAITVRAFGAVIFNIILAAGSCVVCAVGMWMGLREKSPNSAFFMTMIYVFLPPFLLFCFWIVAPVWWIVLFAYAVNQISGQNFRRLIAKETKIEKALAPPIITGPTPT